MVLFFLPILFSAYFCGWKGGVLATLLAAAGTAIWRMPSDFLLDAHRLEDYIQWFVLWITGGLICYFMNEKDKSRRFSMAADVRHRHLASTLEQAVTVAKLGIFDHDLQSDVLKLSETGNRIILWDSKQILTFSALQQRFHPDDREHVANIVVQSRSPLNGGKFSLEHRVLLPDQSIRWTRVQGETLFEGQGAQRRPVRVVGSILDITEAKEHELQLRNLLEERAQNLSRLGHAHRLIELFVKNAPAPIAMLDTKLRYLAVSDRWLKDYGIVEKKVIGRTHYDIFPEILGMPEWLAIHQRCLAGESIKCDEDKFVRTDGRVEWLRWEILPWFDSENHQGGIIMLSEVITGRKTLELERESVLLQEKAARQKAEFATKMKDDFLTKTTHELRTPLGVIKGWLEMIQSGTIDKSELPRILEILLRNTDIELQLVDDILDVSRLRVGKVALIKTTVSINDIVANALEMIHFPAQQKAIQVNVHSNASPAKVFGDQRRLEQIAWNLLSNAVKFTPQGGQIDIKISQHVGNVELQIKDNGIGISPEFLPHVCEPFEQQNSTLTRTHGGLGLGLSIAKSLVEMHGGEIAAASEGIGRGATFTVKFPLSALDNEQFTPKSLQSNSTLRNCRILIVDDVPDVLTLLEINLKSYGATVLCSSSADEAIQSIKLNRPDAIVCDISMPGRDGYDLIRKIRQLPANEGGNLPAIALSAHAGQEFEDRAIAAGFQKYLSKPAHAPLLVETLAELIKNWTSPL